MSEVGTVQTVMDTGDVRVRYPSGHVWTMNVASVVKVRRSHLPTIMRKAFEGEIFTNNYDGS